MFFLHGLSEGIVRLFHNILEGSVNSLFLVRNCEWPIHVEARDVLRSVENSNPKLFTLRTDEMVETDRHVMVVGIVTQDL